MTTTEPAASDVRTAVRSDVWYLKRIQWPPGTKTTSRVITQNLNGPCSLISLCNILILRGVISIEPAERSSVSYEYLSALLADALLSSLGDDEGEQGLSAALAALPKTAKGMDLNPSFTAVDAFRPSGDGGELHLFALAGIQLLHGWLADPQSADFDVVSRFQDYDSAVNAIVEADYANEGRIVGGDDVAFAQLDGMTEDHKRKLHDALTLRAWIDSSSSQLTYYGLFALSSAVKPGQLAALFRNSHLSVLYKPPKRPAPAASSSATPAELDPFSDPAAAPEASSSSPSAVEPVLDISQVDDPDEDGPLYSLVTDSVFANEPTIVWERLEDVEGGASSFFDSQFRPANPAGGDYAGASAEVALQAIERREEDESSRADRELAIMLQREEDLHSHALYLEQERLRQRDEQHRQQQLIDGVNNIRLNDPSRDPGYIQPVRKDSKDKKKGDCIIM